VVTDNEMGVVLVIRYSVPGPLTIVVLEFTVSPSPPKFKIKAPVVDTVLELPFTLLMYGVGPITAKVKPPLAVTPYD
jgi:hypothetical protein